MIDKAREKKLNEFQEKIGYRFRNIEFLNTALTHSSFANESKNEVSCNEKLEFLGDSVLNLIISDYLFREYPHFSEGSLSKVRAGVVSEGSLAEVARRIELGRFLLLGKGEESTGGRMRTSILADAVESVIAAIYLDAGMEGARDFVLKILGPVIPQVVEGRCFRDYKTDLQELLQRDSAEEICYRTVGEHGPDHDKVFTVEVSHGGRVIGRGSGKSKKEAEQKAAHMALEEVGKRRKFYNSGTKNHD